MYTRLMRVPLLLGFLASLAVLASCQMDCPNNCSLKAWTPIFKTSSNAVDRTRNLTLDSVRNSLTEMEDTIIYALIERAQYCMNSPTYDPKKMEVTGFRGSLVEFMLKETEWLHAKLRRYFSPDENPFFFHAWPSSLLPSLNYPSVLNPAAQSININPKLWMVYFQTLLPEFVCSGDDGNYGSTALSDIQVLQALSKRIHYGKFVAEVKYRDSPGLFQAAIREKNHAELLKLVTDEAVEASVQKRVVEKTKSYAKQIGGGTSEKYKIKPEFVGQLYHDWVIPLTKEVEVEYLLHRFKR